MEISLIRIYYSLRFELNVLVIFFRDLIIFPEAGYLCIFMVIYEYLWLFMYIYGYLCIFIVIYVYLWLFMYIYGYLCIFMVIYVYLWLFMYIGQI